MRGVLFLLCVISVLCMYDFTPFEENVLKFFINNFSRTKKWDNTGNYTFWGPYQPWPRDLSLYGSSDVLFTMFITNTLDLSDKEKQIWADNINSFQDSKTGHFISNPNEETCGFEPWHASSYARAALKILGHPPKYKSQWVYDVANSGKEEWEKVFTPLLDMEKEGITIWISSHKLMAFHAMLLMDEKYGEYEEFFDWWFKFLEENVDKETGYWCGKKRQWCPPESRGLGKTDAPKVVGMAGSFHVYIVYEMIGRKWLFPEKVMNWTMSLQGDNGLWDEVKHWTYCVDLDGLFTSIRSSLYLGKAHWNEVEKMCDRYLKKAENILTKIENFMPYLVYSHVLPGAIDAVAECQLHFPHLVKTNKPWKQLVDHVPYV